MVIITIFLLLIAPLDALEVFQNFNRKYYKDHQPYQRLLNMLKSKHSQTTELEVPNWQSSKIQKPLDVRSWLQEILGLNKLSQLSDKSLIKTKAFEINQVRLGRSIKQTFLIDDPILDQYKVHILIPDSLDENSPIVIANHGHGGSADSFINHKVIRVMRLSNPIIVVPEYRAMRRIQEKQISQKLFQYGIFMMGVRINECLKSLELTRKLYPGQRNIFTIGHSGGSNISLLSSWILNDITACIIDYQSGFFTNWSDFCCEGIPQLKNSVKWLYDKELIPTELKLFSYNYTNHELDVRNFLDSFSTDLKKEEIKVTESKISELLEKLTQKSFAHVLSNQKQKTDILIDPQILSDIHQQLQNNQWDIDKDLLIKKLLESASLSYDSEIVSILYPLVKLPSVKLEILSALLYPTSSRESKSPIDPQNEFIKLTQNFSNHFELDRFYLEAISFFCTKSNSALALQVLKMWKPSTPIDDVQTVISFLESSPILLRGITNPSKLLKEIHIPNDLKVLLGVTWGQYILDQKNKHLLQIEVQRISKYITDSLLLPSELIQYIGSPTSIIPSPQKNTNMISDQNLGLLIYVGKLIVKRGFTDRVAELARWTFTDESKLKYIKSFIEEDEDKESEFIHRIMKSLIEEMINILNKNPNYIDSHIDSLLKFFERNKDQKQAYHWLSKFLSNLSDPNQNLSGDKDKILSLIQLGVKLNSLKIINLILDWIPSESFKDEAWNIAFKGALKSRNEALCKDLANLHSNSSMSNFFQNQIRTLEKHFYRTAVLVKNDFIDYSNNSTNQIFESSILLEALEDYDGIALKNEFSLVIETCFLETLKSANSTTFIKLLSLSKMVRIISNSRLRQKINTAIQQIVSKERQVSDDYLELWIHELIDSGENSKAEYYLKHMQSKTLKLSYQIKLVTNNQKLNSKDLQTILKKSHKLDFEDQAKVIIEILKVAKQLPQIQQDCLRKIKQLKSKLDFYDWAMITFESVKILNHQKYFFDSSRLMDQFKHTLEFNNHENDLSIGYNFFHATIPSQSLTKSRIKLRQLLRKIYSKLNYKYSILTLSKLMNDLSEHPYPLTRSLIKELKLFYLKKIKTSGTQCVNQAVDGNNKNVDLFQQFLSVCQ